MTRYLLSCILARGEREGLAVRRLRLLYDDAGTDYRAPVCSSVLDCVLPLKYTDAATSQAGPQRIVKITTQTAPLISQLGCNSQSDLVSQQIVRELIISPHLAMTLTSHLSPLHLARPPHHPPPT